MSRTSCSLIVLCFVILHFKVAATHCQPGPCCVRTRGVCSDFALYSHTLVAQPAAELGTLPRHFRTYMRWLMHLDDQNTVRGSPASRISSAPQSFLRSILPAFIHFVNCARGFLAQYHSQFPQCVFNTVSREERRYCDTDPGLLHETSLRCIARPPNPQSAVDGAAAIQEEVSCGCHSSRWTTSHVWTNDQLLACIRPNTCYQYLHLSVTIACHSLSKDRSAMPMNHSLSRRISLRHGSRILGTSRHVYPPVRCRLGT